MKPDELDDIINGGNLYDKGGKNWIQKAVNPKHKGYCTPMTKSTCTPRRKAFAMTMKKHHGFHETGGMLDVPNRELQYPDGGQIDASMKYYDAQPLFTDALARKYPNVPVKDILQRSVDNPVFHNTRLDQVADSLRNKYGDISLNKHEIDSMVNKGYPNILDINNNMNKIDKQVSGINSNTKGVNEATPEAFGYRMMMQRSYPKGSVPYKYLEDYKAYGGNLMFLGGAANNNTNSQLGAGAAELGLGVATGNPASIVSGAVKYATSNIKNMGTVLKDKDSSLVEKGLTMINPIAGAIIAGGIRKNEAQQTEFNNNINERNNMLGIKANGGRVLLPLGTNQNQFSEYKDGGDLTEFNAGGTHQENIYHGIPQGVDNEGNTNKVEQGETKWQDYIFSDRLLLDKSMVEQHNLPKSMEGKTFAEASKRLSKLIKERPHDIISKNTHKDYMKHLMMANDATREVEESSMMAMGGKLYAGGAPLLIGNKVVDPNKPINNETLAMRMGNTFLNPSDKLLPTQKTNTGLEANKLQSRMNTASGLDSKTDLGFLRDSKNLRYAPIAFDALASTGLFGKSPKPQEYSPTLIQSQGMLAPQQQDEMQMRNAVDASYQTGVSALGEAAGGSGAALRAGLSGLSKDYMSSIGKSYGDVNRANIAQKQAADQFNLSTQANIASQNAQALSQADLYNNQMANQNAAINYDNRMSYLGKGAEGLGDIGYEKRLSDVMSKIYGYDQYGNYVAPLKEKATAKSCGGKIKLQTRRK